MPAQLTIGGLWDRTELAQLYNMFRLLGTPDAATWPQAFSDAACAPDGRRPEVTAVCNAHVTVASRP